MTRRFVDPFACIGRQDKICPLAASTFILPLKEIMLRQKKLTNNDERITANEGFIELSSVTKFQVFNGQ